MPHDPDPTVLHVEAQWLVAVKPAGLLSVPGRGPDLQDCLVTRLQQRWPEVLTVHRLDMATSGLMLFARSLDMQRRLSADFAERRVAKRYTAVVAGEVAADEGVIDLPLAADWPNRPRQQVDATHGKPSLTRWRVLARGDGNTRLALEPVTGRTHQLRVHLAHIGHPILGDTLYAGPPWCDAAPRLLLHASHLALSPEPGGAMRAFDSLAPF